MPALRYLLDTDICIRLLRGSKGVGHRLASAPQGAAGISAITHAELMAGVVRGGEDARARLAALLETLPVMPFDAAAARAFPQARAARGRYDRLIAAHALSLDAALVTHNRRDFRDVPGLRIEDWT